MIDFFGLFELDGAIVIIVALAAAVLSLAAIIMCIVTIVKTGKMKRAYNRFMMGKDTESMEEMIYTRFREIDDLKAANSLNKKRIAKLDEQMLTTFQKVGIVKYDAFNEMGGKLSFSLCMLDERDNGYIINAMHSREGCYTYIKEVVAGKSYIELGEEERQALEKALAGQGDVDLGKVNKTINGSR